MFPSAPPHETHRAHANGVTLDDDGGLAELEIMPFQLRRSRLCYARSDDREWLREFINAGNSRFGTRMESGPFGHWPLVA